MVRPHRTRSLVVAALLGPALVGCSDIADGARQRVEQVGAQAVEKAVEGQLRRELDRAGISLKTPPDCNSDLDLSNIADGAKGKVSCTATTRQDKAVNADFTGTFSADGSCRGTVLVTVDGKEEIRLPEANYCGGQ